jgi:DNA-binding winged helix-turn-helix (wHTH) protein/TolB-like protein/predicted Zn-dependent protease
MNQRPERRRLRFGSFEFDTGPGELYRQAERVRLQEQPRQILSALLERPGEIVTRDELRERLWKTDTFVDFEHGLNTAIKKVRRALGDSAEAPEFIETLARRGYRFVAPVTWAETAPVVTPVPAVTSASTVPITTGRGRVFWTMALVLAMATGAGIWIAGRPVDAGASQPIHLAVMPLRILAESEAPESSYLGVGVADAITARLSGVRRIGLRPTAAVLQYKDTQPHPPVVARELGVQYLLLGTIQPAGDTYRVSVQLVGADGVETWQRSYDEPRAGLLELQDRIAEHVASALRVNLSPPERARLHVRYTQRPAAYDLYLRGRALLVNFTEANMREAIGYFEQALALDQNYALARAALATSAAWFSVRYAHDTETQAWGQRADLEAHRALEQDPSLADAHLAIASAAGTLYGGFNWKTVLDRTTAALALDPSLDLAHVARMRVFYHVGLFDQAREEARLARALNPSRNDEIDRLDIALLLFSGKYSQAAHQATVLLQRQTEVPALRQYLGLARYYTGDATGAREMLGSLTRGGKPDVRGQAMLASIEAATGLKEQAHARLARIVSAPDLDHHVAYSIGAALAQLGRIDESLVWLQRSADTGFPCARWFEQDPLLEPVRRDPGFVRLLERMHAANLESTGPH